MGKKKLKETLVAEQPDIITGDDVIRELKKLQYDIERLIDAVEMRSARVRSEAEALVTQSGRAAMVAASWVTYENHKGGE